MPKRKEMFKTGLLQLTRISSLLTVCISFLMPKIDTTRFLGRWEDMSSNFVSETCFFALAAVCKKLKNEMFALQRIFLCPSVTMQRCLTAWYTLMPELSHIRLINPLWPLPFRSLHSLCFENTPKHAKTIANSLEMPMLQHLSLAFVFVDAAFLPTIAAKCPLLRQLRIDVDPMNVCIEFCNFLKLETLCFTTGEPSAPYGTSNMNVHIFNMPCLSEMELGEADINILEFGANVSVLQRISSDSSCHHVKELIFNEHMLMLKHIDLGCSKKTKIDRFNQVQWENVTFFSIGYYPGCNAACARLLKIQHLELIYAYSNPPIPWHNLQELSELNLTVATCEVLEVIFNTASCQSSLTSLSLCWNKPTIVDLALVAQCVNLTSLTLYGGEHTNFKALTALRDLYKPDFICRTITNFDEKRLFERWRQRPTLIVQ